MEPFQYKKPPPPPEEVQAANRAETEQARARWAEERRVNDHWKRFLLLAGPPLRDLEAAMACPDSCHPTIKMQRHEGGSTCHCQDTPAEREARRASALEALAAMSASMQDPVEEREFARASFQRAATELGVTEVTWGGWVPFQITGKVEGRSFYVRNRHQHFRIEVAPEQDPDMLLRDDPWDEQWLIDDGDESTLFGGDTQDEVYALKYSVAKVRAFLARPVPCPHVFTNEAGTITFAYCPMCGYLLQHLTGVRS